MAASPSVCLSLPVRTRVYDAAPGHVWNGPFNPGRTGFVWARVIHRGWVLFPQALPGRSGGAAGTVAGGEEEEERWQRGREGLGEGWRREGM